MGRGSGKLALARLEMWVPERLQCPHLGRGPLDIGRVAAAYFPGHVLAIDQDLRDAVAVRTGRPRLLAVTQRLFKLPFGPGHWAPVDPAVLALGGLLWKRGAKSRPYNHNDNFDRRGLLDAVLKLPGCK